MKIRQKLSAKASKIALGVVFLCLVTGLSLYSLLQINTFPTETLQKLSLKNVPANISIIQKSLPKAFIVYSGSMEPKIKTSSVVISQPQNAYFPGDVITFKSPNGDFVTHRITDKVYETNDPYFITKGDANEDIDVGQIESSQIVGKVIFTAPHIGKVADFTKTPKGFILFIIIPATIIIYEELKYLAGETKRKAISIARKIPLPKLARNTSNSFQNTTALSSRANQDLSTDRQGLLRFLTYVQNDKQNDNSENTLSYPRAGILIPIIGAFLIAFAGTTSFFSDFEISLENSIISAHDNSNTIYLNEFLPFESESGEWIELVSNDSSDKDITGWKLKNSNDQEAILSGTISAGGFMVIDTQDFLDNNSDTIFLYDASDTLIDSTNYTGAVEYESIGRATDATGSFGECSTQTKGGSNNGSC